VSEVQSLHAQQLAPDSLAWMLCAVFSGQFLLEKEKLTYPGNQKFKGRKVHSQVTK
jgi:hypothetical protein